MFIDICSKGNALSWQLKLVVKVIFFLFFFFYRPSKILRVKYQEFGNEKQKFTQSITKKPKKNSIVFKSTLTNLY